ncbi:hypothetical protein NUU61_004526 [Penicillium alfredii]|uniref:F-box domain-containing protein n=1 Tax=Penicillium alfredii TaxID=1506179 RepID=A0A9W9FLE9_9EURO|nr:uncharacterized protein NUU61_004526 [Penicillium alfredii]KAJ5102304.1 hypothetical protein NUU61_004526 [Penicillium alfredii]
MCPCDICWIEVGEGCEWTLRVRMLYPVEGIYQLSGVGIYHFDMWDASHYLVKVPTKGDSDCAELLTFDISKFNSTRLSRDTFIFHDACWRIIQTCFEDVSIPLAQLAVVLSLVPKFEKVDEDCVYGAEDPTKHVDAEEIVRLAKRQPKSISAAPRSKMILHHPTRDTFAILPPEITFEIARHLEIIDFYNVRLVSRWMGRLFDEPAFWATRFEVNRERGFLSCLWAKRPKEYARNDWRSLYTCSSLPNLCASLQRRNRIWRRGQWIKDVITMRMQSDQTEATRESDSNLDWREIQAHLRCDSDLPLHEFPCYVRAVQTQSARIPRNLTAIVVSFIREGSMTYVTGLQLLSEHEVISLGYIRLGSPIVPVSSDFSGFVVAVDKRGIHALQAIANGVASSWIGDMEGRCVTRRLALQEPIQGIEVCCDVSANPVTPLGECYINMEGAEEYKIVRLAVAQQTPEKKRQLRGTVRDSMFQNALWLPLHPPQDVFFNPGSFLGGDLQVPGFRPLAWAMFGGRDGSDLCSLTDISIGTTQDRLKQIQFWHENVCPGRESISLELGKFPERWSDRCWAQPNIYKIDGPGGERISEIAAVIDKRAHDIKSRYFPDGVPLYYRACFPNFPSDLSTVMN